MINTQTQIDSLIDLAVIQRTELKQLIESLPQLRDHLSSEIERNLEEIEPAIRSELEQFVAARALDTQAKTSAELGAKLDAMARNLESTTAAKYSVLMAERAENVNLLAKAEARIEDAASMLSHAVKEIVTDELSRFPRAGEIDQLRKEFAEPRGLNPRGRWQVGETYNKLDLVSYNGDSYVSSTDGNREKPSRSSEAWTLSAARGNGGGGGGATSLTDLVPVPGNGELLIGNGSAFVNNTLTAGTGVTITNGPGTITIDASGAQELLTASVVNAESVPITRGQVVYLFSATGFRPSVKLANNSADATSAKTFGVVSDNSIAANGIGTVTCVGVVDKLALGAYNDGDTVYLGDTAGTITTTKPYAPNHLVYVGIIERANNGNGELYVKIQNGYELDEIHDVQITSAPLAGALLMRDATNSLWKANRLTGTTNQVTVTNADTAVTLSLPTTIANVNSVTAQTATNLTLTGGSTGASLVLGQGANGAITTTLPGTGLATVVGTISATGSGAGTDGAVLRVRNNTTTVTTAPAYVLGINRQNSGVGAIYLGNDANNAGVIATNNTDLRLGKDFSGTFSELTRLTSTGNLLIGGTTDITGSGGLKVFGTTAASSTATGALQVAGGVGVAGAGYFGGVLNVAGDASFSSGTFAMTGGAGSYGLTISNTSATTRLTTSFGGSSLGFRVNAAGSDQLTVSGSAVNVPLSTASTGAGTGALQVAGGGYFGGATWIGSSGTATPLSVDFSTAPTAGYARFGPSPSANIDRALIIAPVRISNGFGDVLVGRNLVPVPSADEMKTLTSTGYNGLIFRGSSGTTDFVGSGTSTAGAAITPAVLFSLNNSTGAATFAGAVTAQGTGAHTFGTTNTVTMTAGGITATSTGAHTFGTTNTVILSAGTITQTRATGGTIQALIGTDNTTGIVQSWKTNGGSSQRAYIGSANQVVTGGVIADFAIDSTSGNLVLSTAQTTRATIGSTGTSFTGTISPQQATTAGAPAYVKGAIYFDTTLNKLRVGGATAWETITSV